MTTILPSVASPFHAGEMRLQAQTGKRERLEQVGRAVIRNHMPRQHRDFFSQLPFVVLGSVDAQGWPWASMIAGDPGFMSTPNNKRLELRAKPLIDDPICEGLQLGAPIGVVGVELSSRRRNRMNAKLAETTGHLIALDVVQSYGNCPQYIQTHDVSSVRQPDDRVNRQPTSRFSSLDKAAQAAIATASTFFVASFDGSNGADVSHRGGRAGFVKVSNDTLLIPDFAGNNFFNTLGNFLVNPKAGLLFPDYSTGDLLMLTGTPRILEPTDPEIATFQGAKRGWTFTLDHGVRLYDALPFRAKFLEYAPTSLKTGRWARSNARQFTERFGGA